MKKKIVAVLLVFCWSQLYSMEVVPVSADFLKNRCFLYKVGTFIDPYECQEKMVEHYQSSSCGYRGVTEPPLTVHLMTFHQEKLLLAKVKEKDVIVWDTLAESWKSTLKHGEECTLYYL